MEDFLTFISLVLIALVLGIVLNCGGLGDLTIDFVTARSYAREYCIRHYKVMDFNLHNFTQYTQQPKYPFGYCKLPNGTVEEINELDPEFSIYDYIKKINN
jgi:hypothetical protein